MNNTVLIRNANIYWKMIFKIRELFFSSLIKHTIQTGSHNHHNRLYVCRTNGYLNDIHNIIAASYAKAPLPRTSRSK